MAATPFRELASEALRDPVRRKRIEREKVALLGAIKLYELRQNLGLTQQEVADKLGVGQKRVSAIERAKDVKLTTLAGYAEALGGELVVGLKLPTETVELAPTPGKVTKTTRRTGTDSRRRRQIVTATPKKRTSTGSVKRTAPAAKGKTISRNTTTGKSKSTSKNASGQRKRSAA